MTATTRDAEPFSGRCPTCGQHHAHSRLVALLAEQGIDAATVAKLVDYPASGLEEQLSTAVWHFLVGESAKG